MHGEHTNHLYTECGLDFVTLRGVPVYRCANCGEELLSLPCIESLHRVIAEALANKPVRLTPQEVKFLRKYLGYSNADFAKTMGVSAEQASRWTTTDRIGTQADRLLRMLVMRSEPVDAYPIEALQQIEDVTREIPIDIEKSSTNWRTVAA